MAELSGHRSDKVLVSAQAIRPFPLLALSALSLGLALVLPSGIAAAGALGAGAGLISVAVLTSGLSLRDRFLRLTNRRRFARDVMSDASPCALAASDARLLAVNKAAITALELIDRQPETVSGLIAARVADPESVVARLLASATNQGQSCEDVVTATTVMRIRTQRR